MESEDVLEEPTIEDKAPGPERKAPKRFSQRRVKIAIVLLVVAVVVVVLLWGMVPERIYEIHETVDQIDDLEGEYINVKGVIVNWDTESNNFTLADSNDENLTILVKHSGPIPEGFGLNVTAVIKGTIHQSSGKLRMDSDEIQIGCPSKY
jgi:cytochrome c-type biogenesis protein CcmE